MQVWKEETTGFRSPLFPVSGMIMPNIVAVLNALFANLTLNHVVRLYTNML